jgi:hypothetical protein
VDPVDIGAAGWRAEARTATGHRWMRLRLARFPTSPGAITHRGSRISMKEALIS